MCSVQAVLGGRCVETKEDLGPPLNYVHTFIGIGGPNFGNELCALGVPEICNDVNGLNCESRFIRDINARYSINLSLVNYVLRV